MESGRLVGPNWGAEWDVMIHTLYVCTKLHMYVHVCMGMSQNEGSFPGCLFRGYDSWV